MNDLLLRSAMRAHQAGDFAEAARLCRDVLRAAPQNFSALNLLSYLHSQSSQFAEAERLLGEAIKINPLPEVIYNRGCMLQNLGRNEDALVCFRRVAALKPDFLDASINCGIAELALRRFADALASFDAVLAKKPDDAEAWNNRGNALLELGREAEALISLDQAIALNSGYANAWCNRGVALQRLNRQEEALAAFDHALSIVPGMPAAFNNRGNSLLALRRYQDAYADFERASALQPDFLEPVINSGTILVALGRLDEAIAVYDRVLRLQPGNVDALRNRANAFVVQEKFEDAVRDCEAILRIDPDHKYMKGILAHNRLRCCDWRGYSEVAADIAAGLRAGRRVIPPFEHMALCRSAADQLASARMFAQNFSAGRYPPAQAPLWRGERYRHERIRLAYLSADFRNHAVASLTAGLFENHAKTRFETIAFSLGAEKQGAMRSRLETAFERFIDVDRASDSEVAELMRRMEIDIAVDLMGYTGDCRPGILSFRPAPLQINYLGYAATMGTDHIDYIVADRIVIPEHERQFYSEKIAYLPGTYMPNDARRAIPGPAPSRGDAGLPAAGFVFCSFNNSYKFSPDMFDVWMRLLHAIRGSVLWLPQGNPASMRNLKAEAGVRGIAAERLIFAPFVASGDDHLARLGLADLFLDTLPFNAHTSAADALWAGLPVLTCKGETFAGRVAASLLSAAGLPELIADSLKDYEVRALHLARDVSVLAALKEKLVKARATSPLFDTARFTRNLEAAYLTMWERQQRGDRPESFAVADTAAPLPG